MASNVQEIRSLITAARKEQRIILYPDEAESVLHHYNIDVINGVFTGNDLEEICKSAEKTGFPVALKLISSGILHKSDAGCVHLGLNNRDEITNAYNDILNNAGRTNPGAEIEGFLVQEMKHDGYEIIIGVATDPTFGKIIMFGMGGIFVEILKDVAIRKIPVTALDARDMVEEIKGYKILQGARGKGPVNIDLLVDMLMKTSRLGQEIDDIAEVDLNPVFIDSERALVADARIIIRT